MNTNDEYLPKKIEYSISVTEEGVVIFVNDKHQLKQEYLITAIKNKIVIVLNL